LAYVRMYGVGSSGVFENDAAVVSAMLRSLYTQRGPWAALRVSMRLWHFSIIREHLSGTSSDSRTCP
jgi:hypothetical protein